MGNIKPLRKRLSLSLNETGITVFALSYFFGLAVFLFFSDALETTAHHALLSLDFFSVVMCCAALLILVQLFAFSVLGIFFIPAADALTGFFAAASLSVLIPSGFDRIAVLKAALGVFTFVFSGAAVSAASFRSSLRLFRRMRSDRYVRIDILKLAVFMAAVLILWFIGFSDI